MSISIAGAGTVGDRRRLRMLANFIADHLTCQDDSRRSKSLAKFAVAEAGTLRDFRRSPRRVYNTTHYNIIQYRKRKCVGGLSSSVTT